MNNRGMGAFAPPGMEWMLGKTVAQIDAIEKEAIATGQSLAETAAGEGWKKHLNNETTKQQ